MACYMTRQCHARLYTAQPLIRITDLSDKLPKQNGAVTHIIRAVCPATQREEFVLMEIRMYTIISAYAGVAQSGYRLRYSVEIRGLGVDSQHRKGALVFTKSPNRLGG
jgi:hypothetical protein